MKPEFGQRRENGSKVSATVAGKESGNVLNEQPSSVPENKVSDSGCLVEEDASFSIESLSLTGNGHVLAGESAEDDSNSTIAGAFVPPPELCVSAFATSCSFQFSVIDPSGFNVLLGSKKETVRPEPFGIESADILMAGDIGPVLGEDPSAIGVLFALGDDVDSGSFEPEIQAAHAAE